MNQVTPDCSVEGNSTELFLCPECGKPKEKYISYLGVTKVVPVMCSCDEERYEEMKKQEQEREFLFQIERLKCSGLRDSGYRNYNFSNCDQDHPQLAFSLAYVEEYIEKRNDTKSLLFWGDVGTGKTYMAACIANRLMENGIPVMMTCFPRILNALGSLHKEDQNSYLDGLNKYPMLIIDDFGVESGTLYVYAQIFQVIDARYRTGKPMIITTNLSLEEIENPSCVEQARIYDRIRHRCQPVWFEGKNYRID